MTWKRADEADISVESDADEYSEDLTVIDDDEITVETHAEASASSDGAVLTIDFPVTDDDDGGDWTTSQDYTQIFGDLHAAGDPFDVTWSVSDEAEISIELESANANGTIELRADTSDGTTSLGSKEAESGATWSYTLDEAETLHSVDGRLDSSSYIEDAEWVVEISITPSASVDSKSVVTDDITKA